MSCERLEGSGFVCFGQSYGEPFCWWAIRVLDVRPRPRLLPAVEPKRPTKRDEDVRARAIRAHFTKVSRTYWFRDELVPGDRAPRGSLVVAFERGAGHWVRRQIAGRAHVFYPDDRCDDPKCCKPDPE